MNYILGKLGLKHDHYVNVRDLFRYYDLSSKLVCTICGKQLKEGEQ